MTSRNISPMFTATSRVASIQGMRKVEDLIVS
jgi:hypothetical protein